MQMSRATQWYDIRAVLSSDTRLEPRPERTRADLSTMFTATVWLTLHAEVGRVTRISQELRMIGPMAPFAKGTVT